MKERNRLLSGILALIFCFSLIAPAALAVGDLEPMDPPALVEEQEPETIADPVEIEPEDPTEPITEAPAEELEPETPEVIEVEVTTLAEDIEPLAEVDLPLAPSAVTLEADEKIHVTVGGHNDIAVMDITYELTGGDGKIQIDKDGRISFAEDYVPYMDVILDDVSVTATVSYYDDSDVLFVENFNCTSGNITDITTFTQKGTTATEYTILSVPTGGDGLAAHSGPCGVTMQANDLHHKTNRRENFSTPLNGVLTFWYYDAMNDLGRAHHSGFGLFLNAAATNEDPPAHNFFGVAHDIAGVTATDENQYTMRNGGTWAALTGADAKRSEGWHKFQYRVETSGTTLLIDDKVVGTIPGVKSISSIGLGVNNGRNNGTGTDSPNGYHFIDDISVISLAAYENEEALKTTTATCNMSLTLKRDESLSASGMDVAFTGVDLLEKGEEGQRVYLTGVDGVAIESATYSLTSGATNKVTLDPLTGEIAVNSDAVIVASDKVSVEVEVEYYTDLDDKVKFVDNFVGEQIFTDPGQGTKMYTHSSTRALYGPTSATFTGTTTAGDFSTFSMEKALVPTEEQGYTAWAWLYDNGDLDDNFYRLAISVAPKDKNGIAVGILQENSKPVAADPATVGNKSGYPGKYLYRNNSASAWFYQGEGVSRVKGWHKIIWEITPTGTKAYIQINGTGTPQLLYNDTDVTSVQDLKLWTNWSRQGQSGYANILDKYFYDGFTVIANGANKATETFTIDINLSGSVYSAFPVNPTVDTTYAEDLNFTIAPNPGAITAVNLDGAPLDASKWETYNYSGPNNATNYPSRMKGFQLKIAADAIEGLTDGTHILTLTLQDETSFSIGFTAAANTHVARDYYLSNNSGSDDNTGLSPEQAWKSFDKLNSVTFGPGDHIYLDAASVWSGVHFMPNGSGAVDAPIVMTSYGGTDGQRPILNGNGTAPDFTKHEYLAFLSWRKFFPSGTIELYNVEHWEVRGLEITNYTNSVNSITHYNTTTQDATGRCGIAIIHDFLDIQGYTNETRPAEKNSLELEKAYFETEKLAHIIVEDCYVHDVTGLHPSNGASGGGSKMSGGILAFGPYDDLKIEGNVVMYCDVEGIRNDVLAWRGDTRTQFPQYMEGLSISNNFIVGVPGDGVVISCAIEPRLANNYLSDAGYTFLAGTSSTFRGMGNRIDPRIMGEATPNFAGLWFIGTLDAVAEFNEAANNVWICNDGEAFDADMFCRNTVFQYNYTYRNNGGFCLFMGGSLAMDPGTIVRYNVSVEDGQGIGSGAGKKAIFYYNGTPDAIYNNLFVVGQNTKVMFGGDSNTTNFFNNIVVSPDGSRTDFIFNGSGGSDTTRSALSGAVRNNLFYPAEILTKTTGTFVNNGNITPASAAELPFYDLEAFMTAQPIHALNGRSAHSGSTTYAKTDGKGNGTAITADAGRSVTAPNGTGFDYTNFSGIKTVEGASTIGKGLAVPADYLNSVHTLTHDFFMNDITGITTPDIGPYQWSADSNHYLTVVFLDNGADVSIAPAYVLAGDSVSLPTPTRANSVFDGWYTTATFDGGTEVTGSYTVGATGATLYAKWTVDAGYVEVSFDSKGGTTIDPLVVTTGTIISAPTAPAFGDAIFKGWFTDETYTTPWNFDTDTVTASIILYAKWYIIPVYTVTFDSQGATIPATPDTYTVNEDETLPAMPSMPLRDGYGFGGWYTEVNGGGSQITSTTEFTSDVTAYAKWERTVTNLLKFDGNLKFDGSESTITAVGAPTYVADHSGTANSAVKLNESNYLMLTNDEVPVDYSENFTVAFWYQRESSSGDPVIFGNRSWQSGSGSGFTFSVYGSQIRLCATPTISGTATRKDIDFSVPGVGTWAHIAVTFNLSDGKITVYVDGVKAASHNYNTPIDHINSSDLRPTYLGQGTRNSASEMYNNTSNKLTMYMDDFFMTQRVMTDNDILALAQNTPAAITYDVTFNAQGGTSVSSLFDVASGALITAPTAPTRSGYTFAGWYKEAGCTTAWNFSVDTVTANTTLFAKWDAVIPNTYTVSFNSQGGSSVADLTGVAENATITAPTAPTRSGYTFAGWYKEAGCTTAWNFSVDTVTANTTLFAKWDAVIPNTYTVSFNSQGGSSVADLTNVTENATITAPTAPTRSGYTFAGWYKEAGCTTAWDFSTDTVTANTTLFAKWDADGSSGNSTGSSSYTIRESYVDDEGNTLASATTKSVSSGRTYEREAPAIEGYVFSHVLINGEARETALIERVRSGATIVFVYTAETVLSEGQVPLSDGSVISTVIDNATNSVVITKTNAAGSIVSKITVPFVPNPAHTFADVPSSHWANNAVGYVASQGLFSGINETTFAGDLTTTRGMIVTVLHRFAGSPVGGSVSFADVIPGSWYANAASWGETQQIVLGFDDGLFRPDASVTREQAVAFLYRFAMTMNGDDSAAELSAYEDADSVSTWAADAMAWAVGQGIIQGKDGNRLAPQDTMTRYELSIIMERLAEYFVK